MDQPSTRTRNGAKKATTAMGACAAAVALVAAAGCARPDPSADFDTAPSPTPTGPQPSPLAASVGTAPADTDADTGADAYGTTPVAPPPKARRAPVEPAAPGSGDGSGGSGGYGDGGDVVAADPVVGTDELPRCTGPGLTVKLGAPVGVTALTSALLQQGLIVTFTNVTARTCEMYGFPGATLVNAAGDTYDLARRTTVLPVALRLPAGDSAAAVLTYLAAPGDGAPPTDGVLAAAGPPATDGTPPPAGLPDPAGASPTDAVPTQGTGDDTAAAMPAFDASYLLVTPPDDRDPVRVDWPNGAVVDQRHDAYPATYIGPVTH
jgi:hypothetical protein